MKRLAVVTMVIALLLLMMPTAVSADSGITIVDVKGEGEWVGDIWEVEMFPGEVKSTTLTLYNSSSSSLDVEVTITPDSLDNGNLVFELDKTSFAVSRKSYADVTLTVKANGGATPITYTTQLEIKSEVAPAPSPAPPVGAPPDTTPPIISSVWLRSVTETTADICWTTDEPGTSQVEYWTSPSELSALDETYVTGHYVTLTNLTPDTTYYYKTMSEDKAGNLAVSEEYTFTTLEEVVEPIPPVEPEEPEEEEPEVIEPEEEEPEEPEEEEKPEELIIEEPSKWSLLDSIVIGLISVVLGLILWQWKKWMQKHA